MPQLACTAASRSGGNAGHEDQQSVKAAEATWLGSVPDGVKQVMLAMQQMATVAVQSNAQRDPCHHDLLQSLSPDALLACGESQTMLA